MFKSHYCQKSFSIQIDKNIFAEVRAEEKGNILTHRISQSSSSQRRRGEKKRKRKKWRYHLKHQSYVVAPSDSICVILTSFFYNKKLKWLFTSSSGIGMNINKLLLRNVDHRWWSKKETFHYRGSKLKKK